ncbi:uncharacterized protein VP01_9788g1 [Puccinia sorghi]|uniref:Glutamate synthase domain-containing protein n=1 Tax=Puccinia sorghi TaxID=27349 RepID=A0A0L6U5S8_9BASI|nr:uncharacterized protein VP01_9788g1 [Puccinia sorghi]
MSKMGISTLQSYKGAQIFEALGLHQTVIARCFVGTASRSVSSPLDKLLGLPVYLSPVNTTGVISGKPTSTTWCQLPIYKTPYGQRINWHTILTQNAQKQVPEPWHELIKRFCTGAMSYGSISQESHSALAIAMDRLGDKLSTGEAGEDASCSLVMPNGDTMRSAIKQVASGRFGVTSTYLADSDELFFF